MIKKLIKWFKRNPCETCIYYRPRQSGFNICRVKEVATCGCNPYVNWTDRHFCPPFNGYKGE